MPDFLTLRWLPPILILSVMAGLFALAMPHLDVNRHQENWYMGTTYTQLKNRQPVISKWADPYGENGPLGIYPPTAIALATGSLRPMRWYQFLFSLLAMFLFVRYVLRTSLSSPPQPQDTWKPFLVVPVMLAVWISIPRIFQYPVEMNGMFAGLVFFILGWQLIHRKLYLAMFLMGAAYSFKTQWLGMLPGLAIYFLFLAPPLGSLAQHVRRFAICLLLYFLPACVIVPVLGAPFGVFKSAAEFRDYALNGPHEYWEQGLYHGKRLLRGGMSAPHQARVDEIRTAEHSGYGPLTWAHIAWSFGFSLFFMGYTFRRRWGTQKSLTSNQHPLAALACAGVFYWIHFLFIYRYPYWYNVLPIMVFSAPIAALTINFLIDWIAEHRGYPVSRAAALVIFLLATGWFCRYASKLPGWRHEPPGNSLVLYEWMTS